MEQKTDWTPEMSRTELETLDDTALIWKCIEPVIIEVRGKSFAVKSEVYARLTSAQRALMMFQVLRGHTGTGIEEFFTHLSYILSNPGVWAQIKSAMRFFNDDEMLYLLEGMETVYQSLGSKEFDGNTEQYNHTFDEISGSPELLSRVSRLDNALRDILPLTQKRVSSYIRSHPDEFVRLTEQST